ncbi:MAG: enoyl-CoA hydratase-related protein [Sphingomonadaceae bacterium]
MTYDTILFDLSDNVATITLNRPDKMNALTPRVFEEASAAVDRALAEGARALVLTGAGKAFCSGADLKPDDYGYAGLPDDLGALLDAYYNPFVRTLAGLDIPVISAINGPAVGAGLGLALTADISIAARSAYLLLAFVNIGLVPDAGATWLVAKGVGRTKALEMALLGERMSADEALEAGLITRVVDDEAALAEAMAIARKLASGPTVAIGMIRKQVAAALNQTFDETLAVERSNQTTAGRTRDFKESLAAFAEKRPPKFEGR